VDTNRTTGQCHHHHHAALRGAPSRCRRSPALIAMSLRSGGGCSESSAEITASTAWPVPVRSLVSPWHPLA